MTETFEEGNTTPIDEEEDDYNESSSNKHKIINLRIKSHISNFTLPSCSWP